ncbi:MULTISPECIES: hypothetical protein [unclassified Nocardiopsis]|uniref:hypothetical protein n=1 Tax=unclassified Nocardiopsis TaxID=2649073 RepID=UPI0033C6610D
MDARAQGGAAGAERGPESGERGHEGRSGHGPARAVPGWLGRSAAGAGLLLGVAHLLVTGWMAASAGQAVGAGYLVWMLAPLAITAGTAVAALALVRPGARRWLTWVTGTVAVLCALLTLFGFASLAFGASPASLFLGPGPYALPGAVLFAALTVSSRRARRAPTAP